jgi:hypothetical protein
MKRYMVMVFVIIISLCIKPNTPETTIQNEEYPNSPIKASGIDLVNCTLIANRDVSNNFTLVNGGATEAWELISNDAGDLDKYIKVEAPDEWAYCTVGLNSSINGTIYGRYFLVYVDWFASGGHLNCSIQINDTVIGSGSGIETDGVYGQLDLLFTVDASLINEGNIDDIYVNFTGTKDGVGGYVGIEYMEIALFYFDTEPDYIYTNITVSTIIKDETVKRKKIILPPGIAEFLEVFGIYILTGSLTAAFTIIKLYNDNRALKTEFKKKKKSKPKKRRSLLDYFIKN